MKKTIITGFALMAFSILHAQSPSGRNLANRKFHYQGTVHIGMLNGSSSAATNLQTVHRVTYRGWFTGIGIGLDNYSYRTAPLFVELRKNLLNKPATPFLFADIGGQIPWVKDGQTFWWGTKPEYKGKLYTNIGAGYRFTLSQKYALLFSASYSVKKLKESYTPYCDFCVPPYPTEVVNEYTLRRLSLMLGFVF